MERKIKYFYYAGFLAFIIIGWSVLLFNVNAKQESDYEAKLVRLHVVANSDNEEDQQLKLKVRDAVIEYLSPFLKEADSRSQVKNIILAHKNNINNIAERIISESGYDYHSVVQYGEFDFPLKVYGDIVVPEGRYEAMKILLGKAEGKNWWCVLFPPLCFIDMATSTAVQADSNQTEAAISSQEGQKNEIRYKSKMLEIIEQMSKKQAG